MSRDIEHGTIKRQAEADNLAVAVDLLTFPGLAANGPLPPPDTQGMLTTKASPKVPYTKGETIQYRDGNNNNNLNMKVATVVGPSKYQLSTL